MDLQLPRQLQEVAVIEGNIYFFEKNSSFGIPSHMHVCVKRADKLKVLNPVPRLLVTLKNYLSEGFAASRIKEVVYDILVS